MYYARALRATSCFVLIFTIFCITVIFQEGFFNPVFQEFPYRTFPLDVAVEHELCRNILFNISNGRWVRKLDLIKDKSSEEYKSLQEKENMFDHNLAKFRIERGIHVRLWRDDLKCGYQNIQKKPNGSNWGGVAPSWCDLKSSKPCCGDSENGTCGTDCKCARCVDMRTIYHPEFSEWIPNDPMCKIRNYTVEEACDVISRFSGLYFYGDSFVRKMFRGLVLILRNDPTYGCSFRKYTAELRERCVGAEQFYWTDCRLGIGNVPQILANKTPICSGRLKNIFLNPYIYQAKHAQSLLKYVKEFAGKVGSVIILDAGFHDRCNAKLVSQGYLEPAVSYLDNFYRNFSANPKTGYEFTRWPHLIYMYPDTAGLLKPPTHRAVNGRIVCEKFCEEIKRYCDSRKISILDFRHLTSGIHSYDGVHRGSGANLMKVQFLLNYLDSFSFEISNRHSN